MDPDAWMMTIRKKHQLCYSGHGRRESFLTVSQKLNKPTWKAKYKYEFSWKGKILASLQAMFVCVQVPLQPITNLRIPVAEKIEESGAVVKRLSVPEKCIQGNSYMLEI